MDIRSLPARLCAHFSVGTPLQAGLISHAVKLLMSNERQLALAKLGCWLLANVTTPVGNSARILLLQQPATLARLLHLTKPGQPGEVR